MQTYMNARNALQGDDFSYLLAIMGLVLLFLAFFAILFLQSGIDKIVDRKGNLAWLSGHFEKSPLRKIVPLLLSILTGLEMLVGVMAVLSIIAVIFQIHFLRLLPIYTGMMACFTLLSLFFGQRMAKDYDGAAGIVPYLIFAVFGVILFVITTSMRSALAYY